MADHYYSFASRANAASRDRKNITVGTSAASSNPIEVRVTDGAASARDVYDALEFLADLFAKRDNQVIAAGNVL